MSGFTDERKSCHDFRVSWRRKNHCNHILLHHEMTRHNENEFGEVGVDNAILKRKSDEDIIEMNNGAFVVLYVGLSRIVQQILSRR